MANTQPLGKYRPESCAYCKTDTWCEIRANGYPQCRACKVERFFTEILYPPLGYSLMSWQRKVLRDIYGTVDERGKRRYRSAYVSVAKQNGKSNVVGGLPLYHLLMEDESMPEAYGAASAREQAGIVFKVAAQLVAANTHLRDRLKVLPSTKRILRRDGHGSYTVLSADGDFQDGIRPSLLIRDELHRWKSMRAETLLDVTTKGQISREEPLDLAITTAGAEYESPLWWREYQHAKKVQSGAIPSTSLYVAIYEADPKRIESDPEYWKSLEARLAANPSHEALGGFLRDAALVGELDKAIAEPSQRSKYVRYNLNVPLKTLEDPVIDMAKWEQCTGASDVSDWPEYDVELLMREWGLLEKTCVAGVDASWTTDLTATVFLFEPEKEGEAWSILPFFWMPKERVPELERTCRVPFSDWIRRGFIMATDGNAIDLRKVKERIHWGRQMFDLRELAYDRFNFRTEAMQLVDEGIPCFEVQQTFSHLTQPTKFLLSAYVDQKIRHANNPVLTWMASCLQLAYDGKDNCQPAKPHRLKSTKRIDGMAAVVTAFNRALIGGPKESIYESRGMRRL